MCHLERRQGCPAPMIWQAGQGRSSSGELRHGLVWCGMEKNFFVIPARLPGMNEILAAERTNRYKGAALKKETETLIRFAIRAALRRGDCHPVTLPAAVHIHYQERTSKRDLDNVYGGGTKPILDAMQREGLIKNDSQRYVRILAFSFEVGDTDEITVTITTLKERKNGNQ